jgi:hypothetical protein
MLTPAFSPALRRVLVGLIVACSGANPGRADWRDEIGFTRLLQTFTSGVPNALSTGITIVEAPYLAEKTHLPDETLPQFAGKTINDKGSPKNAGASWHSSEVGRYLYGSTEGLLPATSTIDVYNIDGWASSLIYVETRRVQNHSWIARDGLTEAQVAQLNKSIDRTTELFGVIAVVGVDNGTPSTTTLPQLLCQAYNSISVGLTNGNHSAGFTVHDNVVGDTAGRIKPDIVAPHPLYTSFSTPQVSGAAGLLAQKLSTAPYSLTGAAIPRVTKALLLAGATKSEFPLWARTTTRPLDLRYGAGELNVLLSYRTLIEGRATYNQTAPASAWAHDSVRSSTAATRRTYFFDVPAGSSVPFSAALVWHRAVDFQLNATLSDLSLKLHQASGLEVGSLVDESDNTNDNLEHIYQPALPPGRYALVVSSASTTSTDYALAWRTSPVVTVAATVATSSESNPAAPAVFTVTRDGPLGSPLLVPLIWGGSAVSGTHYSTPPASVLIPAGSASATVHITPVADSLAQGDRTVTLGVATDYSLAAGTPGSAAVTLQDKPYDAWRFARFSAGQLADAGSSGESADPDGDGLPNLLEYALGGEPLTADSAARLPTAGTDGAFPTLAYLHASSRPDLAYEVEWTSDLAASPWPGGAAVVTEISRVPASGGELVTVRANTDLATTPRQFLRLRVTRQ